MTYPKSSLLSLKKSHFNQQIDTYPLSLYTTHGGYTVKKKGVILPVSNKTIGSAFLHLTLCLMGVSLITFSPLIYYLFVLELLSLGCLLVSLGIIGLSAQLSVYTNTPQYNLWEKVKHFVKIHKLFTLIVGCSLFTLNPFIILLSIAGSLAAEKLLLKLPETSTFSPLMQFINPQQFFSRLIHFIKHNPLRTVSLLIGASIGITVCGLLLPELLEFISQIYALNFALFDSLHTLYELPGGMSLSFLITATALIGSSGIALLPFFLINITSMSISYLAWEMLRGISQFCAYGLWNRLKRTAHYSAQQLTKLDNILAIPMQHCTLPSFPLHLFFQYANPFYSKFSHPNKTQPSFFISSSKSPLFNSPHINENKITEAKEKHNLLKLNSTTQRATEKFNT